MARPRPEPDDDEPFMNRSKILGSRSWAMPSPGSLTETSTLPAVRPTATLTDPPDGVCRIAFVIRLDSTHCIHPGAPWKTRRSEVTVSPSQPPPSAARPSNLLILAPHSKPVS